jgi:hypothetical protein
MNHWQIKEFGKVSSFSGSAFIDGSEVLCLVIKPSDSPELMRYDILKSEIEAWRASTDGLILGKWERVFSEKKPEGLTNEERKESDESFFLSLFEGDQVLEEGALLSYLFAISLERKRILKSSPVTDEDTVQVFTHVKTKRSFDIPIVVPSKASVEKIEAIIGELLF